VQLREPDEVVLRAVHVVVSGKSESHSNALFSLR
jgi:hypothetical protein